MKLLFGRLGNGQFPPININSVFPIMTGVLVLITMLSLQSCEAFIHARGTVYDEQTKQPVRGVKVQLLWHNNTDTMQNSGYVLDTLSHAERKRMRKQGIADDFHSYTHGNKSGWCSNVPLFTDASGKFQTGTTLVPAIFGVPKVSVLFTKDGYTSLLVNHKERYKTVFFLKKAD